MFGEINKITVLEGASVYECIKLFAETNEKAKTELFSNDELKDHVILMLNRERIDSDEAKDLKTSNGDEIVLYPPVSGG